jgi:hypothetical protein
MNILDHLSVIIRFVMYLYATFINVVNISRCVRLFSVAAFSSVLKDVPP